MFFIYLTWKMTQMRLQITIFSEINNYGLGSFKNDRDYIEPVRPEHLPRSHFLDLLNIFIFQRNFEHFYWSTVICSLKLFAKEA
jgi:hypothetical protein